MTREKRAHDTREPRAFDRYTCQAWLGEVLQWQTDSLTSLQVLYRVRVESRRVPELVYRALAEGRDYCEVWQNGKCLRRGTFAQTTRVSA